MAVGCGGTCAKVALIIYNIIFLLSGLVLIALGIWLIADGRVLNVVNLSYNGTNSALMRNAAIILIAMGALIVVISVIGFVGAIMENVILLGIYIAFLVIIFCGEICGGVIAIAYKDKIVYNLKEILGRQMDDQLNPAPNVTHYYNQGPLSTCFTSDVGWLFDWVQIQFECCGIYSKADYRNKLTTTFNFATMCPLLNQSYYPVSCCPLKDGNDFGDFHKKPDNQYDSQNIVNCAVPYDKGCYDEVARQIERYAPVLIGIGIGFAMLELFGIIFAVCLCRNTGDD
jgi:hypothetical protein